MISPEEALGPFEEINFKGVHQMFEKGILRNIIPDSIPVSFSDRIQNLDKFQMVCKEKFSLATSNTMLECAMTHITKEESECWKLASFDDLDIATSELIINETIHCSSYNEFVLWFLEHGPYTDPERDAMVKMNLQIVLNIFLEDEHSGFFDEVPYCDWYDPFSIQRFVEKYKHELKAFSKGRFVLKEQLAKVVQGDILMEEYVKQM
jgi:hypothetical protein